MVKLVIFGKPNSGKGTFADFIAKDFGWKHISSGDIFREFGDKFKEYLDKGLLIPDKVVINAVKEKLSDLNDFILDGFPRTLKQAEMCGIDFDKAILLTCTYETIKQRVVGRLNCPKCKAIFHVKNIPPKKEGICDHCGSKLVKRFDDSDEKILKQRINIYEKETAPVVEYYKKKGIIAEVNCDRPPEEVYSDIKTLLN